MSWYRDPQLFISSFGQNENYCIDRIEQKYNSGPVYNGFKEMQYLNFQKHLSLGNNKESDYDALKSWLVVDANGIYRFVNCQGLVINYDNMKASGTWSRVDENDCVFYSLPGIKSPFDTVLSLWDEKQKLLISREKMIRKIIQSVKENSRVQQDLKSEVTNLQDQLNQEQNEKQALQTQVLDLTARLQESRGAGGGSVDVEPWMSAYSS